MSSKRRSPTPAPTSAKSTRTVLHQPGQQGSPTVSEAADCNAYDALISLPERTPDAILADERTLSTRSEPKIGREHVRTPVTTAQLVCRLLHEKKNKKNMHTVIDKVSRDK